MINARIDISYRVITGANDSFFVSFEGSANATCTLSPGLYMTSADLMRAVQDAIDDQYGFVGFEAYPQLDGTVQITSTGGTFALDWAGNVSLRNWLGFSGNLSGAELYTSAKQPGVFVPSMPIVDELHGWLWGVHVIDHESSGQIYKTSRRDLWSCTLFEQYENIDALRDFLHHLSRGAPATWHRDTTTSRHSISLGNSSTNAWSYDNYFGRLAVCADPMNTGYVETIENPNNLQSVVTVRLNLVAV